MPSQLSDIKQYQKYIVADFVLNIVMYYDDILARHIDKIPIKLNSC